MVRFQMTLREDEEVENDEEKIEKCEAISINPTLRLKIMNRLRQTRTHIAAKTAWRVLKLTFCMIIFFGRVYGM